MESGKSPVLEFWFEFASTYSHIAAQLVEARAAERGVCVEWKPFLLGPIFAKQGWNDSPFNLYPAKGAYMWRDMERLCAKHGIAFRRPSRFPRSGLTAARVALAAEAEPWLPEFVRRIYLANFADDRDITDPATVRTALVDARVAAPDAWLERAGSAPIKEKLRERTDEAIARGIFGAPTFVAGGELYWGGDRLDDALTSAR
jgi:2-hydroxychromene-2-carboxylate isomerase